MSDIFDALSSSEEPQKKLPVEPVALNDEQFAFLDEEGIVPASDYSLAGLDELRLRRPAGAGSGFADLFPAAALANALRQAGGDSMAAPTRLVAFPLGPET